MEDTYLKDNIKKCVDYVMSKNDDDKRRILNGMFQYNDYLINEQLVVKALNDEEKQEWFNNEIFEAKDKEIERLNNDIKELLKENSNKEKVIIAQDNIINEAREYTSKTQMPEGYKKMILEILNKGE